MYPLKKVIFHSYISLPEGNIAMEIHGLSNDLKMTLQMLESHGISIFTRLLEGISSPTWSSTGILNTSHIARDTSFSSGHSPPDRGLDLLQTGTHQTRPPFLEDFPRKHEPLTHHHSGVHSGLHPIPCCLYHQFDAILYQQVMSTKWNTLWQFVT